MEMPERFDPDPLPGWPPGVQTGSVGFDRDAERTKQRIVLSAQFDRRLAEGETLPLDVTEKLDGWPRAHRRQAIRLSTEVLALYGFRLKKVSRKWRVFGVTTATWSRPGGQSPPLVPPSGVREPRRPVPTDPSAVQALGG